MRLPTEEYCCILLHRYAVPEPIQRHCAKVADVGVFLAQRLRSAGIDLDEGLIAAGCRLHDIFKVASLPALQAKPEWNYYPSQRELQVWEELRTRFSGKHETVVAAEILRPDFPEFADFVAMIGSAGNPTYLNGGWELKIVHYADWRVQFDQITSFDERLSYIRDTYRHKWADKGEGWWNDMLQAEKKIEADIFEHLGFKPDELERALAESR